MARSRCRRTSRRSRGWRRRHRPAPRTAASGRKLRPALPSHCVACGMALASFARVAPPGRLTITVTEVTSRARRHAQRRAGRGVDAHVEDGRRGPRRAKPAARSARPRAGAGVVASEPATTLAPAFLRVRSARCSAQSRSHSRGDCSPPRLARSRSPSCSSSSARRSRPFASIRRRITAADCSTATTARSSRPHCAAPCVPSAQVRFRVHTSGPVTAEVIAPGGKVVRELGRLPHPGGRVLARLERARDRREGSGRRLLPAEGEPLGPPHRAAQPARARHGSARAEHDTSRAA